MTQHPDELDLLSYVEDELPEPRRHAVLEHVRGCDECAQHVRGLELAREALRSAPPLELPVGVRERVAHELDRRETHRRIFVSPMRLVAVLAPIAAVAAVVAAIVTSYDGGGGNEEAARVATTPAGATEQAPEGGGGGGTGGAGGAKESQAELAGPVVAVKGPPGEVARLLRSRGYKAQVVRRSVFVKDADAAELARALADRPRGRVEVILK